MKCVFFPVFADTIDSVRTHPYVQPVVEWSTSLPESEYFIPMRNFHTQVQQHFSGLRQRYSAAYDQAYAQFTDDFDTEELKKLQDWYNDMVNQVRLIDANGGSHLIIDNQTLVTLNFCLAMST